MTEILEKRILELNARIDSMAEVNKNLREKKISIANMYICLAAYKNLCKIQAYLEIDNQNTCRKINKEKVDKALKEYEDKIMSLIKQALNKPIPDTE